MNIPGQLEPVPRKSTAAVIADQLRSAIMYGSLAPGDQLGEAELAGLEAQCWSALGEYARAADAARRAVALQNPHFVRNTALFCAELAGNLAACGRPEEAAATGMRSLTLLGQVRSTRINGMLRGTAGQLSRYDRAPEVAAFRLAVR
jgi:tetratricopeptide (TPR) repeat protein